MITVTEMVRDLEIGSPVVVLSELLKNKFVKNWRRYIQINTPFVGNILMPFPRMGTEKFVVASTDEQFEIERELFFFMGETESAEEILAMLIGEYLAPFAFEHKVNFAEINPYHPKVKTIRKTDGITSDLWGGKRRKLTAVNR